MSEQKMSTRQAAAELIRRGGTIAPIERDPFKWKAGFQTDGKWRRRGGTLVGPPRYEVLSTTKGDACRAMLDLIEDQAAKEKP